ncbi:hypothetical protein [Mesoplasma corruscae]|uniref:Uncharacterized protein n=1 Tax=Mesoplasma corruscae TaxID=216874 RepID=A0A2S5RH93_9MOLU|nr:hypothetical protein [Mesoplasma corruscae]PPE06704.1 hypothetical protein MCORR_v1c03350 [Mesoplasma corruscae]
MSYKVKDFAPILKIDSIKKVNFSNISGETTNIYLSESEDKALKKILLGKIKNKSGRFRIDEIDVINKSFVKRKVEFITPDKWVNRFVPIRAILVFSLFFDLNFLKKARINHTDKKYEYLSLVDSKNDVSDLKVRNEVNKAIEKYLKSVADNHKKLNKNLLNQISNINEKKSEAIFEEFPPQIKVIAKAIYDNEFEILFSKKLLKFNQVLFDKINSINDIRDACPCEYNAKRSKNKLLRKKSHLFKFAQTKYIVTKQAKFIAININDIRLKTIKATFQKRELKKQLKFELSKFYKTFNVSKEMSQKVSFEMNNWQKIIEDLFFENSKVENIFILDFVKEETKRLREYVVNKIHNDYHKLIFTVEIEYGNKNEFAALKKHYKKKVKSIFIQSINIINKTTKRLDLNFEWWLKSSFKISSLNIIYAKILKAINMGKKNIIFSDFLHLLTNNDFKTLMKSIEKINEFYPDVSITILHSKLKTLQDLHPKTLIYATIKNEMKRTNVLDLLNEKYQEIFDGELFSSNKLEFTKSNDQLIKIENRLWNIKVSSKIKNGYLLINPFEVETDFIEDKSLPLNIKIIKNSRFNDKNIYCGITTNKARIFFYENKKSYEKDQKLTIYLKNQSVISIINKEEDNA